MRISSPRLRRLDDALAALPGEGEAMLLSELDGYLAAVILCPELLFPSEWLPLVWSSDPNAVTFESEREAQWYTELVTEQYNAIVRALGLGNGRYAPFLEVDKRHDEVLWELWIEGFATALELRPESWSRIGESGDEVATAALAGLITLAEIARDESDLEREAIDTLTLAAPDLIGGWVETLNAWRIAHCVTPPVSLEKPAAKVGRNDPCSCGSGKKYKKCCG